MSEEAPGLPARPRVLLLGEASLRPNGLVQELTRAGFQLLEQGELAACPEADAVLITLNDLTDPPAADLLRVSSQNHGMPPRLVILSKADPDGPAAALALGAADALVAPVHLPELCARLFARIREYRPGGGLPQATAGSDPTVTPETSNGRSPDAGAPGEPSAGSRILEQRVQEEFERARRYSLSFSLILLGVDELQDSDQRLGADAAARLRDGVTQTLRRELRLPDLVVPYGADEFAIVLPETGQTGARQSLIRMRERLTSLPFEGDSRFGATRFSAGIVTFPHPAAHQPEDLFAMAQAALMRGKAQSIERIGVAV